MPPIFSEKIEDFLVYVELHDKNGKMLWFGWQPSATVIYRETMGRDPKGQVVRLCGDPQCEDPIHLWDVGSEGPPPNSVHALSPQQFGGSLRTIYMLA